ncbi:MAG: hypothetical protein Q8K55_07625 [Gemmatimonadaceae bacterium]|nr:hypothetical protein [Gemmatimonadaceae bacterium]
MHRAAFVLLLAVAKPLAAQGYVFVPRVQPEVRAEAVVARRVSALVMGGANTPLGMYVRAGAAVGAGVADSENGAVVALRADVAIRFLLDPFAENAWGPYAGGGLTVRRDGSEHSRAGLLLIFGVEGRRARRWTPAVEAALGEGVRLAVVWRKKRTNGR